MRGEGLIFFLIFAGSAADCNIEADLLGLFANVFAGLLGEHLIDELAGLDI